MLVRDATPADAAAIATILNALLLTTAIEWTETPYSRESAERWMAEHEAVLVAEHEGAVVGVAAYGWFRDAEKRPGYRFTVENSVHVRQDHWRCGVGQALMRALVVHARNAGRHTMIAAVDGANDRSIRFHELLGFVEMARLREVGEKFGSWQDLVLLQLRLDDRASPSN